MASKSYDIMTLKSLRQCLDQTDLDSADPSKGCVLVNVLSSEKFAKEHIPGSINIPAGDEDEFEKRYSKNKEIIVYCASTECDASEKVAKRLAERGFTAVHDFEAGLKAWKDAGYSVAASKAA